MNKINILMNSMNTQTLYIYIHKYIKNLKHLRGSLGAFNIMYDVSHVCAIKYN